MNTQTVKRHFLDLEKTLPYFTEHLKNGNTLSTSILNTIDFYSGSFFTLLPSDAALDRIYAFEWGGVIPPIPFGKKVYDIPAYPEGYQPMQTLTLKYDLSKFINFYLKDVNKYAVLEEVLLDKDDFLPNLENVKILYYNKEIYYLLDKTNTIEQIHKTTRQADAMWHFLVVLLKQKENIPSILTKLNLDQFCTNANFIIIRAYDGESFIFWERSQ